MVAAAISCLTAIQKGREIGQVQPVVDEPFGRVREIEELAEKRHSEIKFGSVEPRFLHPF